MLNDILNNPVRIYNIIFASLALLIYYVPSLPEPLILGLVVAICGVGGEIVRGNVSPVRKVDGIIADAVATHLADKPIVDVTHVDTSPSVRVIQ